MTYEPEQVALGWFLGFIRRRAVWIILVLLVLGAFFLRCLHLLNPARDYILSPDSYFFHWLAQRAMAGEGPPPDAPSGVVYYIHSGLAYPLAYIAKAVASIFNMAPADALDLVSKFLPPMLGIISLVVIYLVAVKLFDRRIALFSAFAWALMLQAVFLGAGGFLDRDGLSTFLLMLGAVVFYLSTSWHLLIRNRDVGWLLAGIVVLLIEALLYLQWSLVGSILLLAFIVVYFVVKCLLGFVSRGRTEPSARLRLSAALGEANWQTLVLIILANAVMAVAFSHQFSSWITFLMNLLRYGRGSTTNELQGLGFGDLLIYNVFLVPLLLGIYLVWKKRDNGTIFFTCSFLFFLILSLFSKRILFFAAPAACVLCGVGMISIWDWAKVGGLRTLRKVGVVALLFLMILVSFITSASIGSGLMSADKEWQDAMTYLREKTPQDSVVMSEWGWGYWILDLGQRRPLVDNGFYGYDVRKLSDVSLSYSTGDPSEAVRLMGKNGAQYLVFSKQDLDIAQTILSWADLSKQVDSFPNSFPEDSLVVRSLKGKFESGSGLEVVYRSSSSEVVILGLAQSGEP